MFRTKWKNLEVYFSGKLGWALDRGRPDWCTSRAVFVSVGILSVTSPNLAGCYDEGMRLDSKTVAKARTIARWNGMAIVLASPLIIAIALSAQDLSVWERCALAAFGVALGLGGGLAAWYWGFRSRTWRQAR